MSNQEYNEFLLESILEAKDLIPGGLADKLPDSEFDSDQLEKGIKAELEHTSSRAMAKEIAKDHLKEDPKYYDKLEKMESESLTERSHYAIRKTAKGDAQLDREHNQHKKTRNTKGHSKEQDARKRKTKHGKLNQQGREATRQALEKGEIERPKTCPKCGSTPGSTSDGKGGAMSNMIRDHDQGYGGANKKKGQWMCRTCHNKKDNNKPGEKSVKNKRTRKGAKSISKSEGDRNIARANRAESKERKTIRLIADNLNFLDNCK